MILCKYSDNIIFIKEISGNIFLTQQWVVVERRKIHGHSERALKRDLLET
jgi:hypothetical protein